jgi:hypothetical protein
MEKLYELTLTCLFCYHLVRSLAAFERQAPVICFEYIVTYWVSLVVLHMRSNNVNVAATINSASCYSSVVTQQ